MNICMVVSAPLPPREGIGYYVWNLSRYLVSQGHEVHIITRGSLKRTYSETREGITLWHSTFVPFYPWHVHLHSLLVRQLITRMESSVDVFHVHSPLPPIIQTRRPTLLTVHTALRANVRSIQLRDILSLLVKLQAPVSFGLEQQLLQRATCITAYATSVAHELSEYGIESSQVELLGNGVETGTFTPSQVDPDTPAYVFAAARLGLRKGFEDLIECARLMRAEFPRLQFWIAGSGPLERSLRTQVARADLKDVVIFLGHIGNREKIIKLYQGATLFLHPAHYEGLPAVLLEAMACGRPCVATAVSGALDVIEPGVNGLLVPPHSPSEMAAGIRQLLVSPQLAERLGQAARRTVEARYSWKKVGAHYVQLYRRLAEAR